MALPILVPIALAAAGLFGIGKAAKAAMDNSEANDIARSAEAVVSEAEQALARGKDSCNDALRGYGEQKLDAIGGEIQTFVDHFGRLKNVKLAESPELDRLQVGAFTEVSLEELKHSCSFAGEFAASAAAGMGAGAITAFGAYGGTMMLASAGTGTAIGTLSGAAATNATLAWLGGGTLAAGGYGVAGGTMVLGILVAGPALLVLGSVLGAQASKKLDEARANMEKATAYEAEIKIVLEKLKAIIEAVFMGSEVLNSLKARLHDANIALAQVIELSGTDYSAFSDAAKDAVFQAVKLAQLMKAVIDTPILREDGSPAAECGGRFAAVKQSMPA